VGPADEPLALQDGSRQARAAAAPGIAELPVWARLCSSRLRGRQRRCVAADIAVSRTRRPAQGWLLAVVSKAISSASRAHNPARPHPPPPHAPSPGLACSGAPIDLRVGPLHTQAQEGQQARHNERLWHGSAATRTVAATADGGARRGAARRCARPQAGAAQRGGAASGRAAAAARP